MTPPDLPNLPALRAAVRGQPPRADDRQRLRRVFLLIGGILAIGVVLTRWPAIHWLPADTFYLVLTAHGIDMLIFWIIFFEIAVLYFASSTLLRCRLATPKIAWLAFALMVIGAVDEQRRRCSGRSSVMMTATCR